MSRSRPFDLPPWGMVLCIIFAFFLAVLIISAHLSNGMIFADNSEEVLYAPIPDIKDKAYLSYNLNTSRMVVTFLPNPDDVSLSLSVARIGDSSVFSSRDIAIPLYGPVTFWDIGSHPLIQYSYTIREPHILTVTVLNITGGISTQCYITRKGGVFNPYELEVTHDH